MKSTAFRVGIGFDAHRLVVGRRLVLGGVEILHDRGLEGHSDGDALLHALTDAVLGAVGALDIGSHFPSGDPRWQGASSRVFLERAREVAREKGYRVAHVDSVVIAEEPKLAPYFDAIRSRVAEILGLSVEDIGVKATTADGMGFTGRREGIAAQAVVLVERTEE